MSTLRCICWQKTRLDSFSCLDRSAQSRFPNKKAALRPGMAQKNVTSCSRRKTFLIFIIPRKQAG